MTKLLKPGKAPCKTCPYRKDVPSGVWHPEEYEKLPKYDGDTFEQLEAPGVFMCHQQDGNLCAGWVGCHDMGKSLAIRLHHRQIDPMVYDYVSPIELFSSGAEAAAHGMQDVEEPSKKAEKAMGALTRQRANKKEKNHERP